MVTGLVTEFVIGRFTERSTSRPFPATRFIASQAAGGPAALLIAGMGTGMISTAGPVLAVCGGIFWWPSPQDREDTPVTSPTATMLWPSPPSACSPLSESP